MVSYTSVLTPAQYAAYQAVFILCSLFVSVPVLVGLKHQYTKCGHLSNLFKVGHRTAPAFWIYILLTISCITQWIRFVDVGGFRGYFGGPRAYLAFNTVSSAAIYSCTWLHTAVSYSIASTMTSEGRSLRILKPDDSAGKVMYYLYLFVQFLTVLWLFLAVPTQNEKHGIITVIPWLLMVIFLAAFCVVPVFVSYICYQRAKHILEGLGGNLTVVSKGLAKLKRVTIIMASIFFVSFAYMLLTLVEYVLPGFAQGVAPAEPLDDLGLFVADFIIMLLSLFYCYVYPAPSRAYRGCFAVIISRLGLSQSDRSSSHHGDTPSREASNHHSGRPISSHELADHSQQHKKQHSQSPPAVSQTLPHPAVGAVIAAASSTPDSVSTKHLSTDSASGLTDDHVDATAPVFLSESTRKALALTNVYSNGSFQAQPQGDDVAAEPEQAALPVTDSQEQ